MAEVEKAVEHLGVDAASDYLDLPPQEVRKCIRKIEKEDALGKLGGGWGAADQDADLNQQSEMVDLSLLPGVASHPETETVVDAGAAAAAVTGAGASGGAGVVGLDNPFQAAAIIQLAENNRCPTKINNFTERNEKLNELGFLTKLKKKEWCRTRTGFSVCSVCHGVKCAKLDKKTRLGGLGKHKCTAAARKWNTENKHGGSRERKLGAGGDADGPALKKQKVEKPDESVGEARKWKQGDEEDDLSIVDSDDEHGDSMGGGSEIDDEHGDSMGDDSE